MNCVRLLFGAFILSLSSTHPVLSELDLQEEIRTLGSRVEQLEAVQDDLYKIIETSLDTTMYSFSTRLHENTVLGDGACIFGTVDLNIGDGYDEFVGVFTPPVSGVYLLTVYARTEGSSWGSMFIKSNEQVMCHAELGDGTSYDVGTCTAIAELTPQDTIRVTGSADTPATIQAYTSGFAGHLIQEYD